MFKKFKKTMDEFDVIMANFEKGMVDFDKDMDSLDSVMSDLGGFFEPHPDQNNRINMEDLLELDNSIKWDD